MSAFNSFTKNIRKAQWILIGIGLIFGVLSAILGVSDNPPGIILIYLALTCLAVAWVWNLPAPRDYWTILVISLAAFPLGVILHNIFYALAELLSGIRILQVQIRHRRQKRLPRRRIVERGELEIAKHQQQCETDVRARFRE